MFAVILLSSSLVFFVNYERPSSAFKVKFSLCTLQRHKGSGCTAPLILILSTRWGKWSASRPGRFFLCKAPWVPTEQEAG